MIYNPKHVLDVFFFGHLIRLSSEKEVEFVCKIRE